MTAHASARPATAIAVRRPVLADLDRICKTVPVLSFFHAGGFMGAAFYRPERDLRDDDQGATV